jgi:putative ABC transport system permease protein
MLNQAPPGEPYRVATPEYFTTVGVKLLRGRTFTADDRLGGAMSVVINDALVRRYYPDRDPIGREIYLGAPDNRLFPQATIVGVVSDTRDGGLDAEPLPTVFIPMAMMPTWPSYSYVIRTSGDPTTVAGMVRSEIRAVDPTLPVENVTTMHAVLRESVAPARWSTTLLGSFAAVALVMAALGVFGVLSYTVTQRTRELGIRIALGAAPGAVRRLVVGQGMTLAVLGVAIGLAGALALTRFLEGMLFGVTRTDPVTYVAVSLLLVGVAAMAAYLPARRATRVDPMVALRAE